jgi:WD40 repeat protein
MIIHEDENSAVRFSPDGTLEFASGTQARWKLFDGTERIFTVSYRNTRPSLKLMPGRGLVETNNPSSVVFQRNR